MPLILMFAVLGLLMGGVRGLLIGALIGYLAGRMLPPLVLGRARAAQSNFLDSTFAVMGALCKADGQVTRDEIRAAENVFDLLRLSPEQRGAARQAFRRGKSPEFDPYAEAEKLSALRFGGAPLLRLFLQIQCMAVAADGNVHPAEHEMLVRLARRLGLTEQDVAQLESLLRAAAGGPSGTGGVRAPQARLADAYNALGVSPEASDAEVKRAYRRIVSQNHPDKLAAKGMPESMRQVAEERTREINVAYDLIKEVRGFS